MAGWTEGHSASRGETGDKGRGRADKYLTVSLGEDRFGIPVARVKEIIECSTIASLPMAPSAVRGTINLRGRVVPVVDLAVRFGCEKMMIGRRTCIVIAEIEGAHHHRPYDVGLLVDAVNEVIDIVPEEIEEAPTMDGAIRTDFAMGMGKVRGTFVLLLRIEALVAVSEMQGVVHGASQPLTLDVGEEL